jgi:tetratricopeptide (TPR) repeat protein
MPTSLRHPIPAALLALSLAAGCHRQPPAEQAETLASSITEIRAHLPADPTAEQAPGLEKPATRAEKAYARLTKLQETNPQNPAIAATRAQIAPAYAEVRRIHRLGTERHKLADLMGSLKVRGYRAGRTLAVPKLLSVLAAGARQAAVTELEHLPKLVRETAELGAALVGPPAATANTAPSSSKVDWLAVAARLDSWNTAEPADFPLALALGYTALGETGFALVELDRVDPSRLSEPEQAALVPLARAFVFSRLGFTELAAHEAAHISGDDEAGRQMLAAVHAVLAYNYAAEKDWKQMDRELAQAVRIWPDNPLVVFLSGERLLADGRKEQALETLARAAAGSEVQWLAPALEKRIREVRDSDGEVPPLLLDNGFIVKCAMHSIIMQAKQTEAGRKVSNFLTTSQLLPSALGNRSE